MKLNSKKVVALSCSLFAAAFAATAAPQIVGISIPVNSCDQTCKPLDDNLWSMSAPLNPNLGIAVMINPVLSPFSPPNFTFHDHVYLSPNVPDPSRAVI